MTKVTRLAWQLISRSSDIVSRETDEEIGEHYCSEKCLMRIIIAFVCILTL